MWVVVDLMPSTPPLPWQSVGPIRESLTLHRCPVTLRLGLRFGLGLGLDAEEVDGEGGEQEEGSRHSC